MDARLIDAAVIALPLMGPGDERSGGRTTYIHIREKVAATCADRTEAVLYAYLNNELVAALDSTRLDGGVCVNMVFVKPQYRRRGIGSALIRHMTAQHPRAIITWTERSCGKTPRFAQSECRY